MPVSTRNLLIISDEFEAVDFIKVLLESEGDFRVFSAISGAEALRIINETSIDLIVIDVMMAGVDGFKLCRIIREEPRSANAVIYALASYETVEMKSRAAEAGATSLLIKPLAVDDFIGALKSSRQSP